MKSTGYPADLDFQVDPMNAAVQAEIARQVVLVLQREGGELEITRQDVLALQ